MEALFTLENFITLGLLTLLQCVLGLDNLLYISLESKRAPVKDQARVRKIGIIGAIVLRLVLLFVLLKVIVLFQDPLFEINLEGIVAGVFNLHSLIVLMQHQTYHLLSIPVLNLPQKELEFLILRHVL